MKRTNFFAAWCFVNMASSDNISHIGLCMEVAPTFINEFLLTESTQRRELACWFIGNISSNKEYIYELLAMGCFNPIVNLLKTGSRWWSLLKTCSWTLCHFLRHEEIDISLEILHDIENSCKHLLLKEVACDELYEILWLYYFIIKKYTVKIMLQNHISEKILEILEGSKDNDIMLLPILKVYNEFISWNVDSINIVSSMFLNNASSIFGKDQLLVKELLFLLSNITAEKNSYRGMIISNTKIMNNIIHLLTNPTLFELKKECLHIIVNLAVDPEYTQYFYNLEDLYFTILEYISHSDLEVSLLALTFVESMLKFNSFIIVQQTSTRDILETTENHPNQKISTIATSLLECYF
eukprot:TRINITY_DN4597_c0_g1_i1.p1 TRINITY_DN4597_c0_g1~~TRINITY_DN4597_c0_g1_i1.p1  ORF type:complete len:353 (-),score=55.24 TRINITY_DN4597_c0_g1_i1:34-1092(-)